MKTPSFLYPLCVTLFSCGSIMLINQLVTGISVATQAQCSGVEYLSGNEKQAMAHFCRDNGYYVGQYLQQQ